MADWLAELVKAEFKQKQARLAMEEKLRGWAKPPSDSEKEKCERAVRMVKAAIDADPKLSRMDLTVFPKGSFHNRTNIPTDSDVDVGVVKNDLFLNEYPPGLSDANFNLVDAPYNYSHFKTDVANAIVNHFGRENVTVGSKAIKVHSNTARVDADVVPHMVHRRYHPDRSFLEGVALQAGTQTIHNWPNQDYDNGVAKNERTGKRYKALVRILKNIRGEMDDAGYASAKVIPSYLISCLTWNVPDATISKETFREMVSVSLDHLIEWTAADANVKEWGEANELKYLFRPAQGWTRQQAFQFLVDARDFLKRQGL